MSYATVTQLREYLGQVANTDETTAILTATLERATDIVNDALGFQFEAYGEEVTAKDVRAPGGEWLWPPAYEAGSIESIARVIGRGDSGESTEVITGWVADEDERPYRVWRSGGWVRDAWYRVTAIWGYGLAPKAVVEVTLEVAVNIWRGRDASAWQNAVGVEGQGAVSFNRALTWAQRSILDGVRRRYLGVIHA